MPSYILHKGCSAWRFGYEILRCAQYDKGWGAHINFTFLCVRLFCGSRYVRDRGRPALNEGKMPSILGRVAACVV